MFSIIGDNVFKYLCIVLAILSSVLWLNNRSLNNTITSKESTIKELQTTLISKRSEIETQNALIKQNEVQYKTNLENAKKANVEIKERYKIIYKNIDTFKGDQNATDCDNLRNFGNSIKWVR